MMDDVVDDRKGVDRCTNHCLRSTAKGGEISGFHVTSHH
jgi:hypothetical protein